MRNWRFRRRTTGWILTGEIDAHTAPLLAAAMADLPTGVVTVDVAGVSFMDSSGLPSPDRRGDAGREKGVAISRSRTPLPASPGWSRSVVSAGTRLDD